MRVHTAFQENLFLPFFYNLKTHYFTCLLSKIYIYISDKIFYVLRESKNSHGLPDPPPPPPPNQSIFSHNKIIIILKMLHSRPIDPPPPPPKKKKICPYFHNYLCDFHQFSK